METYAQKSKIRRVTPFLLIMFAMLVTGGISLAGMPAAVPAKVAAHLAPAKGDVRAQAGRPGTTSGANTNTNKFLSQPAAPDIVLYDQYNNASGGDVSSQDFEPAFATYWDQAADDFTVPSGQPWTVSEVDAEGDVSGVAPTLFNIYFYTASGALPATPVFTATSLAATQPTTGNYVIPLTVPAVLPGNTTYWVSVQARLDFTGGGQWYWQNRSVTAGNPAAWRNPGAGFAGGCMVWGVKTTCLPTQVGADQIFRLVGTAGSPASPTPANTPTSVPTNTPTTTNTPIATDTPTSTPSETGTSTPMPTATACTITFSDVPVGNTFYLNIRCLACRGIINGYSDGTFRPNNNVTRGQLSKIVSNAAGFSDNQTSRMFRMCR